jgi:hypothetical protein
MHNFQKSRSRHSQPRTPKPLVFEVDSVEVVGDKTYDELESDWLKDFRSYKPTGRPEGNGWLTVDEMALRANVGERKIRHYLKNNKEKYEQAKGTIETENGSRAFTFYRLAKRGAAKVHRPSRKLR